MTKKKEKTIDIHPKFLKDEKGKITDVYLDIKTYEAIQENLKKWRKVTKEDIKKELIKKETKKS